MVLNENTEAGKLQELQQNKLNKIVKKRLRQDICPSEYEYAQYMN